MPMVRQRMVANEVLFFTELKVIGILIFENLALSCRGQLSVGEKPEFDVST